METTLIIIKPDAVERNLIGEIIKRYEEAGLKVYGMKKTQANRKQAREHYAEHSQKPFFDELIEYITRSEIVVAILEGDNAVALGRKVNAEIREEYSVGITENCVHGSDSFASAIREINIWF